MSRAIEVLLPRNDLPDSGEVRGEPIATLLPIAIVATPAPSFVDLLGHTRCEAQRGDAEQEIRPTNEYLFTHLDAVGREEVEHVEEGRSRSDPPMINADLALLHALMGHYARTLWDMQKVRLMMGNRLGAMERDGVPDVFRAPVQEMVEALEKKEAALNRQLAKLAKQHPMAAWIGAAPGIGLPGFARLMGVTGPLDRFATVSKLWAYLGMHVSDGAAPKRRKGESANWSSQGRVLCHQLGESIVKVGRGPYREAYDRKKADYEANRLDWTQARRHNAAMRYAVKELLKDLWQEWRAVMD